MAKMREEVCRFYIAFGQCEKGRDASQKGYCQKCSQYEPRAKRHHINRKRQELEKIKGKDND